MFTSIRAKLGIVFLGFLLLGAGSVTASFVTVNAQAADALVINLAGRQRMLTQRMTKAALGVASDRASDYRAEVEKAAILFEPHADGPAERRSSGSWRWDRRAAPDHRRSHPRPIGGRDRTVDPASTAT